MHYFRMALLDHQRRQIGRQLPGAKVDVERT